jgi:SAM-dependent methyltransferase
LRGQLQASIQNKKEEDSLFSKDPTRAYSPAELLEVEYWRTSPSESPDSTSVENILHKCSEARVLLAQVRTYSSLFARASTILELGAGQAWASALVKREFPGVVAYASDISPYAVRSVHKWEHVFCSKVDRVFACPSDDIPLEAESVDLVFCFQAAHHFRKHRSTLVEIRRILKSGGVCLYLQEPCCPFFWYPAARWRVNRKRGEVLEHVEDVIVHKKLAAVAEDVGFEASYKFVAHTMNRPVGGTIYYAFLGKVRPLQHLLPCTADFIFHKR